jgi:hypothetical protein
MTSSNGSFMQVIEIKGHVFWATLGKQKLFPRLLLMPDNAELPHAKCAAV